MRFIIVISHPYIETSNYYLVHEGWGWDLSAQLEVCDNLDVFAPISKLDSNYSFKIEKDHVKFHPLPYFDNYYKNNVFQFLGDLYRMVLISFILLRDIKEEDTLQSSGVPWIPVGVIAQLIAIMKGCNDRIFVLDSDLVKDFELKYKKSDSKLRFFFKFISYIYFNLFKFIIAKSKITFTVGDGVYGRYKSYGNVFKIYGSWIRENDIITYDDLNVKINQFIGSKIIRLTFASTLKDSKNPKCVVEAAKFLKNFKIPFILDLYGNGPLKGELIRMVRDYDLDRNVKFKGHVEYGDHFYRILRQYDMIFIPNLSGEQPRIIFDALANGVFIVGSNITSFNKILNDENSILCDPENPMEFAMAVKTIYENKEDFQKVRKGIKIIKGNTIESMHEKRIQIIRNH
ncbi:MAG: glycosyltransferase [Methanobacterium sp.]|jgi:glycosyltransferase involved in cell wall biosynthesis|nr:glycosyltransferase [Methanobacterium sp.]